MKKLNIPFLFIFSILFFVSTFSFSQDVEEMQLIGEEKLETKNYPTDHFLLDKNGAFISAAPFTTPKQQQQEIEIKGKKIIVDWFLNAIVNFEAERIYAIDPTSNWNGSNLPYNGIQIYDLEGNKVKNYLEKPTQTFERSFIISKAGNLLVISNTSSDSTSLIKLDSNGNLLWKTYFTKKNGYRHSSDLTMKISPNGNIAISDKEFFFSSRFFVFNGEDGRNIFTQSVSHHSRILAFNDKDLILDTGLEIIHYSIYNDTFFAKKFPYQSFDTTLPSSDSTGKYFGIVGRDLTTKEDNQYSFLFFEKESDHFILHKKITLRKYDLFKKEPTAYSPTLIYKTYIDENGIVSLFCQDNKLLKFK